MPKHMSPGGLSAPKEHSTKMTTTEINSFCNFLMGKILTIVEASTTDKVQRDALKSVIGNEIHTHNYELQRWMLDQDEEKGTSSSFPYFR